MSTHDILSRVPGYTDHEEAIQRLDERLRELNVHTVPARFSSQDLADVALSNDPFPENHILDNDRLMTEATSLDRLKSDYRAARRNVVERQRALLTLHEKFVLGEVEKELLRITKQVKVHALTLGSLRSEADVYRTRNGAIIDAWESLLPLTKDYESIRGVQYGVYSVASTSKPRQELACVADFVDSFDVSSFWRSARRHAHDNSLRADTVGVRSFLDWLKSYGDVQVDFHEHGFRAGEQGIPALIGIALHARPWAPTLEIALQMLDAGGRMVGTDLTSSGLASRETARDKWFKLTKAKPLTEYENFTNGRVATSTENRMRSPRKQSALDQIMSYTLG